MCTTVLISGLHQTLSYANLEITPKSLPVLSNLNNIEEVSICRTLEGGKGGDAESLDHVLKNMLNQYCKKVSSR